MDCDPSHAPIGFSPEADDVEADGMEPWPGSSDVAIDEGLPLISILAASDDCFFARQMPSLVVRRNRLERIGPSAG
jgi:hypothetical protein